MSGRRLVIGFLIFLAVFTGALIYFQFFAYYTRTRDGGSVLVAGRKIPISGLDRIDATSSPLKLRSCFRVRPNDLAGAPPAPAPTPLTPPPWFRCFDAGQLTDDLAAGAAAAYLAAANDPDGFDRMVAVYPDGRGYEWRQLNATYTD